jgi:hypothetical protein
MSRAPLSPLQQLISVEKPLTCVAEFVATLGAADADDDDAEAAGEDVDEMATLTSTFEADSPILTAALLVCVVPKGLKQSEFGRLKPRGARENFTLKERSQKNRYGIADWLNLAVIIEGVNRLLLEVARSNPALRPIQSCKVRE